MFSQLGEWITRLISGWKFWLGVPPWDIGVRVRLGRVAAALQPGLHFRLPLVDEIILVNTRLRIEPTPTVTVNGSGNRARVVTGVVGYAVIDPVRALLAYTYPGAALLTLAQSKIAGGGTTETVLAALRAEATPNGLDVQFVYFTEDVQVRTYRLLQGGGGSVWAGASPSPGPGPNSGVSQY